MRYSTRTLLIAVATVAIMAAVIGGAIRAVTNSYRTVEDFYAIDQTCMMLLEYMDAHGGEWPSSWSDLEPYFDKYKRFGWSEDIESLSTLVEVNFAFSPEEYFDSAQHLTSNSPKLVSVTSYRNDIGWEDLEEVNRRLMAMLRREHIGE